MAPCRIEWVMIKILVSVVRLSIGFISLPFNFCSFVLISRKQIRDRRQNQKIKAARKWLKSLLACLKEKNSPDFSFLSLRAEKIQALVPISRNSGGIRQFFFFNAISMMPRKKLPFQTRKLHDFVSFCQLCESCLIMPTQENIALNKIFQT